MKRNRSRKGIATDATAVAACALAAALAIAPANAQQVTGVPGSPSATTTIDGKQLPPPPPKFGGVIKESAKDSKTWWPPRVVPPKGAPNVLLIMTDDQGYGVRGTFGGVIPTPALDRVAKAGLALHAIQLDGALLADARRAHHRPQPPLGRLRRDLGIVDRLSGLRLHHRSGERDDRQDPRRQRLRHVLVRQESQHAGLPVQRFGALRPMAVGHGLPVLLRLHGRRDRPMAAVSLPRSLPDLSVDRQEGLQPDHRHGGRGDPAHAGLERRRARPAVLRLLRARRKPLAASAEEGMDREVQGQVRHGLGEAARADLRQPEAPRRDPGEREAHAVAGRAAEVGFAFAAAEEALRAASRGLCRRTRPTPTTRSVASSRPFRTWASSTTRSSSTSTATTARARRARCPAPTTR